MKSLSKDELYKLYVERGYSLRQIGRLFGISHHKAKRVLQKYGIPVRCKRKISVDLDPSPTLAYLLGAIIGDCCATFVRRKTGEKGTLYHVRLFPGLSLELANIWAEKFYWNPFYHSPL